MIENRNEKFNSKFLNCRPNSRLRFSGKLFKKIDIFAAYIADITLGYIFVVSVTCILVALLSVRPMLVKFFFFR